MDLSKTTIYCGQFLPLYNSLKINIEITIMKNRRLKLKQIRKQYLKNSQTIQRNLNSSYWSDSDRIDFLTLIELITKN